VLLSSERVVPDHENLSMPSTADMIFPGGEPRDGNILQLELVGSWESQLLGLGRLTAFLTPRLLEEAFAVDDMGVNVVFLQRHRVEVGLKLILERMDASAVGDHNIDTLWKRCDRACREAGFPSHWEAFGRAQREFAYLLNRVDPNAATFRYPVNKSNQPWERGQVDLMELENAGAAFQVDLMALVRDAAGAETMPIGREEAAEAAEELRRLVVRCRGLMRTNREIFDDFSDQMKALRALNPNPGRNRPDPSEAGIPEFEAIAEVIEPLASRAEDLLGRVVETYALEVAVTCAPEPITPAPRLRPFDPPAKQAEAQKAQIKWFVDLIVREFPPLAEAVDAVCSRSASWETPAARQIHLDATRFRSRLFHMRSR
jgi:hypothetical protein